MQAPAQRPSRIDLVLTILVALGAAGCVAVPLPPPNASAIEPAADPTVAPSTSEEPAPSDAWLDLPLTADSRDLLAVIEPGELVTADVFLARPDNLAAAATAAGLANEITPPDAVSIRGSAGQTVTLLRGHALTSVSLSEDDRALRWIPDARPIVSVPMPGRPYAVIGVPAGGPGFRIPLPQRDAILAVLAGAIQTIDGRPYVHVQLSGDCDIAIHPSSCTAELVGQSVGGARAGDWWTVISAAATNWSVVPGEGPILTSVPRPLLRAVEWIARHDRAALDRIRQYETCCSASWTPASPGRITLGYSRACRVSVEPPDVQVADTGCNDTLTITVDVGPGTVVSIEEQLAGAPVTTP